MWCFVRACVSFWLLSTMISYEMLELVERINVNVVQNTRWIWMILIFFFFWIIYDFTIHIWARTSVTIWCDTNSFQIIRWTRWMHRFYKWNWNCVLVTHLNQQLPYTHTHTPYTYTTPIIIINIGQTCCSKSRIEV